LIEDVHIEKGKNFSSFLGVESFSNKIECFEIIKNKYLIKTKKANDSTNTFCRCKRLDDFKTLKII